MIVNETTYHSDTPEQLVRILEAARAIGTRLVFEYGDAITGRAWGDAPAGRIGRSTGSIKIPLVIKTRRSYGGEGLLDHCIVRLRTAKGKLVLYVHPTFHQEAL